MIKFLAFSFIFAASGFAVSQTYYHVTDLGDLGGDYAMGATGVNDSGQVAGYSQVDYGGYDGFLYSGGTLTDLGTFGGNYTIAEGINANGDIAGGSRTANDATIDAFLYSGGAMHDLGTLPGGSDSVGWGINNSDQVTGYATTTMNGGGPFHAVIFSGGAVQDLGTLPGGSYSEGFGINNSGQVVGVADNSSGETQAFLYSGGALQDLGTLGGAASFGYGINDSGQVVGYSDTSDGFSDAFLYTNGTMKDLGRLPGLTSSTAVAINNSGEVVGTAGNTSGPSSGRAFLYSGGALIDLNTILDSSGIGVSLVFADGIANNGDIAAVGSDSNGLVRAFLLTPGAVPAPSAFAFLGIGVIGLVALKRRK